MEVIKIISRHKDNLKTENSSDTSKSNIMTLRP